MKWEITFNCDHAQWPLGPTQRGLKFLDTRRLAPGVYTVEVIQAGKRLLADKFIIRH